MRHKRAFEAMKFERYMGIGIGGFSTYRKLEKKQTSRNYFMVADYIEQLYKRDDFKDYVATENPYEVPTLWERRIFKHMGRSKTRGKEFYPLSACEVSVCEAEKCYQ